MPVPSLCLIGGSGYVGSAVAKRAIQLGMKITSISRRGAPAEKAPWQSKVNYLSADASNPATFAQALEQSDAVIYTVGTLLDTTYTKNMKPGQPGTYEYLNRDCAIKVADYLQNLKASKRIQPLPFKRTITLLLEDKKMVYLSAEGHPPFIPRYITTKEEAEAYILSLSSVQGTILKPGFIYSSEEKWWSGPLRLGVDSWHSIHKCAMKSIIPGKGAVNSLMNEFAVAQSVRLQDVVDCSLISATSDLTTGKRLFNKDITFFANTLRTQQANKK